MDTGRALTFILLSSAIMMTALFFQGRFAPQPVAQQNGAAEVQPADEQPSQGADASESDPNKSESPESASPINGEQESKDNAADTNTDEAEGSQENALASDASEPNDPVNVSADAGANEAPAPPQQSSNPKEEFITLGSLNDDGTDRYLITANRRGGTIRRVELNYRELNKSDKRYKYRDMVFEGGYLGELECFDSDSGCEVAVVGAGTPAAIAGVQVGDIIKSFNGESVVNQTDLQKILADKTKSKRGQTIELGIERSGTAQQISVNLTAKPIELVRPEPGWVDPEFDYPESFVFSLLKPMDDPSKAWPDLAKDMRDGLWDVASKSNREVVFEYTVDEAQLAKLDLAGPITIRKTFRIPELAAENIQKLDSKSFHIDFDLEVINGSDRAQTLAFELDGPTGIPAETWWYGYKIHGRQTAIGSIGGARDIVGSTQTEPYIFYGCPEIVAGAKKKSRKKIYYLCDWNAKDPNERLLNWAGVDAHYFNISLIPKVESGFETHSVTAFLNGRNPDYPVIPKNVRTQKLMDVTFQMTAPLELPAGGSYKQSFEIFCGPKEEATLSHYGLTDVRTFGWFSWCSLVLLKVLHFFYWITGSFSYGLAIILLTVLVRCCMIPFSRKAALNAQMMQFIQPEMKEIADKYKEDLQKRSEAQRALYKKYNFNPFGGCLVMFIQLPVFYGLYKGLNVDIALRDQPFMPGLNWCTNLAAPDRLLYWKDWMPFGLGEEASWLGPYFNLLPILTMFLFILQQRLFTPPPTDDQQAMMQKMMTFMMLFMGLMFFKVPSGLCIYFITSSLWAVIERKLLPKPVLDTDNIKVSDLSNREAKKLNQKRQLESDRRQAELDEKKQRNAERKKRLKQRGQ